MAIAILAALIGVPIAFIIILRSNATLCFFALCSGIVLQAYLTSDFWSKLGAVGGQIGESFWAGIIAITLPLLLSVLLTARSSARSKLPLTIWPTLAVGALYAGSIVPLLPGSDATSQIVTSDAWRQLQANEAYIIVAGILLSLVLVRMGMPKNHSSKHKH